MIEIYPFRRNIYLSHLRLGDSLENNWGVQINILVAKRHMGFVDKKVVSK